MSYIKIVAMNGDMTSRHNFRVDLLEMHKHLKHVTETMEYLVQTRCQFIKGC